MASTPLTPAAAVELIRPFFDGGWSVVDHNQVIVERMIGGYCNTIYKVSRPDSGENDHDPVSVIVRIRGGNVVNNDGCDSLYTNAFSAILIATYELGRR